jgi:hypothetical protein
VAGQASVEFLAVLPVVAVLVGTAWQFGLAGWTWWSCAGAARAGARAAAVGGDVREAALGALPSSLDRGVRVRVLRGSEVSLVLAVPRVVRGFAPGSVSCGASFGGQQ